MEGSRQRERAWLPSSFYKPQFEMEEKEDGAKRCSSWSAHSWSQFDDRVPEFDNSWSCSASDTT